MIGSPSQIWLAVAPVDMRRGIDGLSAQAAAVGWQRGMVLPAPFALGAIRLAAGRRGVFFDHRCPMGLAHLRGGLATFIGLATGPSASLIG